MSRKRIHPSLNSNQMIIDPFEMPFEDDPSEYECLRKKVKQDFYEQQNNDGGDSSEKDLVDQNDLNQEIDNLYGQEFQNLRACSFKTISKIGLDKNYLFTKNQVVQQQDNFSSANRKKTPSLMNLSEEKSKTKKPTLRNNIVSNCRKQLGSFGSLNEISKMEKRNSFDSTRFNGIVNRIKKRQSSFSGMGTGSLNSINTQMMNEIIDFTINDENELDEICLSKMMETALIKNVKFSANLYIEFLERKNEQRFYPNLKMYKILDVDGFSIKGFYEQNQKIRINLKKPITNKDFQKKFVLQPQPNSNIVSSKQQSTKQHGVQFEGNFYDFNSHSYEEVKFNFSQIKDNVNNSVVNNQEIQNINFENWMIPQESFDCSFGFGNYMNSKNQR